MGGIGLATVLTALLLLVMSATPAQAQSGQPPSPMAGEPVDEFDGFLPTVEFEDEDRSWQLLRTHVLTYTVQPGDNDWAIAQMFNLDVDTLRFSNEWMRRNPDLIHPGKEVVILPVRGAYHTVEAGDTLESIAERYGVNPNDIARFALNDLGPAAVLRPGQKLIIPGGRLDYAERIQPPGPGQGYALAWPMRGYVTQGYRQGHRALDLASFYGAKVYASRGGRVVYARFSPDGWLGFRVVIAHGNGLSTSYSHLSGIFVEEGQEVARGDVLGQVGSTGNSTGPHVHFEVYRNGAKLNPLDLLPSSADQ
jgi:LysM repeat protein